jgi:inorganic pyrophosphatase
MEVTTDEPLTPIRQDKTADGKALRHYPTPIEFNYGMLPRTWEDPSHRYAGVKGLSPRLGGDGDPLDVVEIGSRRCSTGSVHAVRPLGVLALIDGGELDFKIVAVRQDDVASRGLRSIDDVDADLRHRIMVFFRDYKLPKQKNTFGFGGEYRCHDCAWALIRSTHAHYQGRHRRSRSGGPDIEVAKFCSARGLGLSGLRARGNKE